MFKKAPGKMATKMKNVVHKFAVKGIKRKTRKEQAKSGGTAAELLVSPKGGGHVPHHSGSQSRTLTSPRVMAPKPPG